MKNEGIQLDFNFCRNLDFQKNLNVSVINDFMSLIFKNNQIDSSIIRKHLKFLIIELFCCWYESRDQFLAVSMSKRGYKAKSRYNPNMISSYCIDIIKFLKDKKLIEFYPGFYDCKNGFSRLSRIKASVLLVKEFENFDFNIYEILNLKKRESLFLYDEESRLKEYEDTFETHEIREVIINYNRTMMKTFFDIPSLEDPYVTRGDKAKIVISQLCVIGSRDYNLNWNLGGTFSGSWWHKLDVKSITSFSKHMLINDSDTTHIDLANLFSYFLSKTISIENIDLRFDFFKKKIVFLSEIDQLNYLILKGINSKNFSGFFRSFCNDKKKLGIEEKISKKDLQNFLDLLEEHNNQIYRRFFSNSKVNWDMFVSKVFYDLIRSIGSTNIPIIKIRDKIFFQTKFERNIVDRMNSFLSKLIGRDDINLISRKSFGYEFNKKKSLLDKFIGKKLSFSKRYIENKKNFFKLIQKNKVLINQSLKI